MRFGGFSEIKKEFSVVQSIEREIPMTKLASVASQFQNTYNNNNVCIYKSCSETCSKAIYKGCYAYLN